MFSMEFLDQAPRLLNLMQQKKYQTAYYKKLCKIAPDQKTLLILQNILKEEEKHYDKINAMYKKITGCMPIEETIVDVNIISFSEGLKQAITEEISMMDLYKDLYISLKKNDLREIIFEIIMDELKHNLWLCQIN